jgi:putative endonuclease
MNYLYVLRSEKDGSYYIGQTKDLEERIVRHNSGHSKSTRARRPWKLVYYEIYENRGETQKREIELKRKKNKRYIEFLIRNGRGVAQSG